MKVIEVNNVTKLVRKDFQQITVLKNINLTINSGDLVWLNGESGAGKTTLLSLICGLISPSSGEIKLMGLPPKDANAKLRVGVVFQETQVPKNTKVKELIELFRSYSPNPLSISTEEILARANLTKAGIINADASSLAGGEKQRLYFALALIVNPKLLILDEPTNHLDEESRKVFWEQLKLCHEKGIAILMTTQIPDDRKKLNELATHIITLHEISKAPEEGQLIQEQILTDTDTISESAANMNKEISNKILSRNILGIFTKQLCFEIIQLLRTPTFLLAVLSFVGFVPLFKMEAQFQGEAAIEPLVYLCGIILFTVVIERLGKRVAVERSEGWLKLLQTTSLPPMIYISAKISSLLIVCILAVLSIFILGHSQLGIQVSLGLWFSTFLTLIIGIIPFAIMGLELGYLLNPKSADSILSLSLFVLPFAAGAVPAPIKPELMQDLVSLSPFYHYKELVFQSASLNNDGQILLHLLWLVWAFGVFGLSSIWIYKRDRTVR
jgi:ABC-2 type transport system ATP-binding protein